MNFKKIFGIFLLIFGLLIIMWGLYSSYNIFNGKKEPPAVFKIEKNISSLQKTEEGLNETDFQNLKPAQAAKELQKMLAQEIIKAMPFDLFVKLLNLIAWSIFCGLLFWAGAKIAGIGAALLK